MSSNFSRGVIPNSYTMEFVITRRELFKQIKEIPTMVQKKATDMTRENETVKHQGELRGQKSSKKGYGCS